jgi:COMPASS component SPP1
LFKLCPKKQNKQNNIENSPNYKFYSKILNHGFDPIHLKAAVAIKNEMEIKSLIQVNNNNNDDNIQQCQGPSCINVALITSKYCSNECGLQLAAKRMQLLLPDKLEQYTKTPINANQLNLLEINRINQEITILNEKIVQIDQKQVDLNLKIETNKKMIPLLFDEKTSKNNIDFECVTCGKSVNEKNALKHIEDCFNKTEMKSYYGLPYEHSDLCDSFLCGFYDPKTELYCRRIKILCPEHTNNTKNQINDENEICGCFGLIENDNTICFRSKKICSLHYKWELKRNAQFHLEKLQLVNLLF